jgi:type I restriction enzyme S subunit
MNVTSHGTTVGDIVTFQRGFDITKAEQSDGPYPVISSSGPTSTHSAYKVKGPGVVIGRKGSLGGVYFSEADFWPHDTTLWVKDLHGNDARFLYYWLQTLGLGNYDVGASNPTLNRNHLHLLPASVPDVLTQRKIAAILSAYDDLIENNNRRIKLLEEMAQRIYREWFVDFRYPGHEGVPLVDSELGPVPEGWAVCALGNVATVNKGLSYTGAYLTESGVPMANLKCFDRDGGFRREGTKPYSGPFKQKQSIRPGDLIVANTDLTQAGNVIGSPAIVPRRGFEQGGLISHHLFVVRSIRHDVDNAFLYHALRDDRARAFCRGRSSGTTVLGLRTADYEAYPVVLPPSALLERYSDLAGASLDLGEKMDDAAENLRAAQDLLLPRLISGEIDVTDLDIAMPEVAA